MEKGDTTNAEQGNRTRRLRFFSLLAETASNWMDDNAMRLSAALSLYTLLSLAPLLVISLKVVSVVAGQKQAIEAIDEQLQSLMGPDAAGAVKTMIENGSKHGNGVTASVISTILLIISATGVFVELQDSMNTIWGVKPRPHQGLRNFVRNRLLSIGMVFGIGFLLLVSMIISTVIAGLARFIPGEVRQLTVMTDIVVSFFVVYVLFAGMLKVLPDVRLSWQNVSLAALLTAVLFTLGKYGLTLYFKFGTPTSAFGAAGSLVAVLLWVYYSAFILFFGAEFAKVCSIRREGPVVPESNAVPVDKPLTPHECELAATRAIYSVSSGGNGARQSHKGQLTEMALVCGAGLALGMLFGRSRKPSSSSSDTNELNGRLDSIYDLLQQQPIDQ